MRKAFSGAGAELEQSCTIIAVTSCCTEAVMEVSGSRSVMRWAIVRRQTSMLFILNLPLPSGPRAERGYRSCAGHAEKCCRRSNKTLERNCSGFTNFAGTAQLRTSAYLTRACGKAYKSGVLTGLHTGLARLPNSSDLVFLAILFLAWRFSVLQP